MLIGQLVIKHTQERLRMRHELTSSGRLRYCEAGQFEERTVSGGSAGLELNEAASSKRANKQHQVPKRLDRLFRLVLLHPTITSYYYVSSYNHKLLLRLALLHPTITIDCKGEIRSSARMEFNDLSRNSVRKTHLSRNSVRRCTPKQEFGQANAFEKEVRDKDYLSRKLRRTTTCAGGR